MNKEPEFVNIKSLLGDETRYVIPLFQRDYAWGIKEVHQLIEDIAISKYNNENKRYHIGSIVLNQDSSCYDVIDGQQRLTTLHLINAYLNKENLNTKPKITKCNLDFCDLRPDYNRCMEVIYQDKVAVINDEEMKMLPESLMSVYHAIPTIFKEVSDKYNYLNESELAEYFMEKVVVLRIFVPSGTDLNHYFQVMNMRGEQLEKHEILKAELISKLDKDKRDDFAKQWDECSAYFSMQRLDPAYLDSKSDSNSEKLQVESKSLRLILSQESLSNFTQNHKEYSPEFDASSFSQSVVDFPNFLMIVLKIYVENNYSDFDHLKDKNIPLNDDLLIDKFREVLLSTSKQNTSKQNSELIFSFGELMSKLVERVKNYIMHNNSDRIWTIGLDSGDTSLSMSLKCIIALQSMFHSASPSKKYKYWLYYALKEKQEDKLADYSFWEDLARVYLIGRYSSGDIISYDSFTFDDLLRLRHHKKVDMDKLKYGQPLLFPLKLYDYLLWKEKLEEGKLIVSVSMHSPGKSLIFSSDQNSVEHFYPQCPIDNNPKLCDDSLNMFGNLCLVSSSNNSRLTNNMPEAKCSNFEKLDHKSFKLSLMMRQCKSPERPWHPNADASNINATIEKNTTLAVNVFNYFLSGDNNEISKAVNAVFHAYGSSDDSE